MFVLDVHDLSIPFKRAANELGMRYVPITELDASRRHILWYSGGICLIYKRHHCVVLETNIDAEYNLTVGDMKYHLHNPTSTHYFKKVLQLYCKDDADVLDIINGTSKRAKLECVVPSQFICSIYYSRAANPTDLEETYVLNCRDIVEAMSTTMRLFNEFLEE